MSDDGWRARAAKLAQAEWIEFAAILDAVAGTKEDQAKRIDDWEVSVNQGRIRKNFPQWAPLDVCFLYLIRIEHKTCAPQSDNEINLLRQLLSATGMRDVWARIESKGIDPISFARATIDAARIAATLAEKPGVQAQKCRKIAQAARELSEALRQTPFAFDSIFQYIPDKEAEKVANHCMRNPYEPISYVPHDAQSAVEKALPVACNLRTALGILEMEAEAEAGEPNPYGKSGPTRPARAFVVTLANFFQEECGCSLPEVAGKCCSILLDVHFEPRQIKEMIDKGKTQEKSRPKVARA